MHIRIGLLVCLGWLLAQEEQKWMAYGGSEVMRHRYHRENLPPTIISSGFLGGSYRIAQSGRSYQIRGWFEGRLGIPMLGAGAAGRFGLVPGATVGLAFQVAIPEADQLYLQLSPGLDTYWMQLGDPTYTSFSIDWQLRPILFLESGLPTRDGFPFFMRYGFYPVSGSTYRIIISFGTYFMI